MGVRPKYLLFGVIGVMFLYVLTHSERFLVDPTDGEWMHIQSFKWWLLPHAPARLSSARCSSQIVCDSDTSAAPHRWTDLCRRDVDLFLEVRVIFNVFHVADPHWVEIIVWSCTASSLFVADVVLQVQEMLRMRPRTRAMAAAVAG
jgi:hypothetical protein